VSPSGEKGVNTQKIKPKRKKNNLKNQNMKQVISILNLFFVALMILVTSCRKTELPQVLTLEVAEVTKTTATVSGKIVYDGGDALSEYGICFSTGENPGIADNKVVVQNQKAYFSCELQTLLPGTRYYARAYARNKNGVAYGKVISFLTEFETITDIEGNVYNIVQIGTQTWMAENLSTTILNNGTPIPHKPQSLDWENSFTSAYCWYNNDYELYGQTYGALYNHKTVQTGRLCPEGWKVPSDNDWMTLIEYLGGESVAGGKLKETETTHWRSPNTGASNQVNFSALPGGYRHYSGGIFMNVGNAAYFWSSSKQTFSPVAYYWSIYYGQTSINKNGSYYQFGYSVRCVKI
jgi:uncharacterized protein (TIGR02145 family)